MSFWTHNFCPFDSKMIDIKLDSLDQELKPNFKYSNVDDFSDTQKCNNEEVLKPSNKQKKKVTFLLSSEDQISSTNNDILNKCEQVNTNLVKNNISNNDIDLNSSSMKDDTQMNFCKNPSNMNFNDNEKRMNEHSFDFQTNKLKVTEGNSDFEFKKPFNPVQESKMNQNLTQKTFQPSTTNYEVFSKFTNLTYLSST